MTFLLSLLLVATPTMERNPPCRLQGVFRGLHKLSSLLEDKRCALWSIVALLTMHSGLLAYSAYVHSPTICEPGHLVAGLSHWKFGRFELYRVNPPLVRMVAALPVMAAGYEEDWSGFYERPGARLAFELGERLVTANGERSFFLFVIARLACIPLSWIGGITCYMWARDLYGRRAGVMACALWVFSPNILAHASLITADAGGTALGVTACYTFWRWLKKPTWKQAALTGVILGLAELAKTTLILFYPLWPLLWIAYRWKDRHQIHIGDWVQEAGMLILRMIVGLYILNLGYGFEGSFKQLREYQFVSDLFSGQRQDSEEEKSTGEPPLGNNLSSRNRFSDSFIGLFPVPLPKNYVIGIDIQQRDFESYAPPSYMRGVWQDQGWWYYYLYAAAIKVPLGIWLLGLTCFILQFLQLKRRHKVIAEYRDLLILLVPPLVIFLICSEKTGFSSHFRYVLPCFPFLFIWISSVASQKNFGFKGIILDRFSFHGNIWLVGTRSFLGRVYLVFTPILLLWLAVSSMWVYPHSLSYFNEMIGGPINGPKHLLGSCVGWGQDLRYLSSWVQERQDEKQVYVIRDGFCNPNALGIDCKQVFFDGKDDSPFCLQEGFYVVSVNAMSEFLSRNPNLEIDISDADGVEKARHDRNRPTLQLYRMGGYSFRVFNVEN